MHISVSIRYISNLSFVAFTSFAANICFVFSHFVLVDPAFQFNRSEHTSRIHFHLIWCGQNPSFCVHVRFFVSFHTFISTMPIDFESMQSCAMDSINGIGMCNQMLFEIVGLMRIVKWANAKTFLAQSSSPIDIIFLFLSFECSIFFYVGLNYLTSR